MKTSLGLLHQSTIAKTTHVGDAKQAFFSHRLANCQQTLG